MNLPRPMPEGSQGAIQRCLEIKERLKIIRTKRHLLGLKNPQPNQAVLIQIAEYDVEEAELEPQLRRTEGDCCANEVSDVETTFSSNTFSKITQIQDVQLDLVGPRDDGDPSSFLDDLVDFDVIYGNTQTTQEVQQVDRFDEIIDWTSYNCQRVYVEDVDGPMLHDVDLCNSRTCPPSTLGCTYPNVLWQLPSLPGTSRPFTQRSNTGLDNSGATHMDIAPSSCQGLVVSNICVEPAPTLQRQMNWQVSMVDTGISRKRRREEADIPGTSSFSSRPLAKRTRRQMTEGEQQSTNHVRHSRACLRCRISKVRVSNHILLSFQDFLIRA